MKPLRIDHLDQPPLIPSKLGNDSFNHIPSPWGGLTWECIKFWLLNALFAPLVATVYVVIVAEGLRLQLSVFATRLYKLPVPGVGLLRQYDGFDRLDLAVVMSLMLFIAVTYLWIRIWNEIGPSGTLNQRRHALPIFFWLQVAIASVILLFDASIFYMGLQAKASSGWSQTSAIVPLVATVLYAAGLAMLGAWHAEHYERFSSN